MYRSLFILGLGLALVPSLFAEQPVETLVDFDGLSGDHPNSLIQSTSGEFFGTSAAGGQMNQGALFMVKPHEPIVTLVSFNGANGAEPVSCLELFHDGNLYGATRKGGAYGKGTLYRIRPDHSFQTLVSFGGTNGSTPEPDLAPGPDGIIYGCTDSGGTNDLGTIFTLDRNGQMRTVVNFNGENGANPRGLTPGGEGSIFGTTSNGGSSNLGTIFRLNADGSLVSLHQFHGLDGAHPASHLAPSDDHLFHGTTTSGGSSDLGTVYTLTSEGTLLGVQSFDKDTGTGAGPNFVEWYNGYFYMESLMGNIRVKSSGEQWLGRNFCGTTTTGGCSGHGTVFRVTPNGMLVSMVSFSGTCGKQKGSAPNSLFPGQDGNLYGTTLAGGEHDKGTIFRLLVPVGDREGAGYAPIPITGLAPLPILPIVSR